MVVEPYLFFDGRCEEAIEFYKKSLHAEVVMMMRFGESPEKNSAMTPPGAENKIMHANVRIGNSTIMASDGQCKGQQKFQGFALSYTADDTAEAERAFNALSDGGQIQMPLTQTFFSPRFGMVADRFGVSWMVLVRA